MRLSEKDKKRQMLNKTEIVENLDNISLKEVKDSKNETNELGESDHE